MERYSKSINKGVFFLILVFIIFGLVKFLEKPDRSGSEVINSSVGTSSSIKEEPKAPSVDEYPMGKEFTFKDYGVTVQGYTKVVKGEDEFLVVKVTVKNVGKSPLSIDTDYFQLFDTDGRTFDPQYKSALDNVPAFSYDTINPGLKKTGAVTFQVPKGIKSATLTMQDSMFDVFETAEVKVFLGEIK